MIHALVSIGLAACSAGAPAGNPDSVEKRSEPATFRIVEAGEYGAASNSPAGPQVNEPSIGLARDAATYRALWQKYVGSGAAPEVDFARETALFLVLGQQSSGGYGISPLGVNVELGTATVETAVRAPGSDSIVATVITAPFAVIAVSNRDVTRAVWRVKDREEPLARSMERSP